MTETLLAVRDLVAGYVRDAPIVRGISLNLDHGEIVTVLGPNGAGKSTLLKAVMGLLRPSGGDVRFGAASIVGTPTHLLIRRGLAYVPQLANVFLRLSVEENLDLGAPAGTGGRRKGEIFAMFPDLAGKRAAAAGRLSGGQRQMLALGRALMAEPRAMLLDEPSAGLAPLMIDIVFKKLIEVRRSGVALLVVEQNARAALAISDRAYVLAEGRNRIDGPAQELLRNPAVGALYLGGAV